MRKSTFIYSTGSFTLSLAATALLTIALAANPFAGFYLLVSSAFILPLFMQLVLRTSGPGSALTSLVLFGFGAGIKLGPGPALFAAAYLLLPLAAYTYCLYRGVPAAKTMTVIAASYVLGVLALYALSFRLLGKAPFEALPRLMIEALEAMPERDSLFTAAYRYGILAIPDEMAQNAVLQAPQGGTMLSPEVLTEFYKQIHARAGLWLRALVPSLLSSFSIYLAFGGVYMSDHYGRRQAQRRAFRAPQSGGDAFPVPPELKELSPFHKWFIPKQAAAPLWIMGGVSLLTRFSGQEALALSGAMLYNIFSAFFGIQGLSTMNFMQRRRGTRPGMRGLTIVILAVLLPQAALVIGLFDQVGDQRKLRKPDNQNNSDTGRK